jgi:hypothetical protein
MRVERPGMVPVYYVENERELLAYRKVLNSLAVSGKTFGEYLQELYRQFTGESIPEIKIIYNPHTHEAHYRIRVEKIRYRAFLRGYCAMERYIPYLEHQVDLSAIERYREIGDLLMEAVLSMVDDEADRN